jgi:hypothetical protein
VDSYLGQVVREKLMYSPRLLRTLCWVGHDNKAMNDDEILGWVSAGTASSNRMAREIGLAGPGRQRTDITSRKPGYAHALADRLLVIRHRGTNCCIFLYEGILDEVEFRVNGKSSP